MPEAKKTVGTFRVKVGFHNEGGVTYGQGSEAGDIVESCCDLAKYDPNKFEALQSSSTKSQSTSSTDKKDKK